MNYTIKVFKKNGKVDRYESKSKRRFCNHVGTINWKDLMKVSLRVSYEPNYYNEGEYDKKSDFLLALKAFLE